MPTIIFFSICIVLAISSSVWTKTEIRRLNKEYQPICIKDSLNDYIIKVKRDYRSDLRIDVNHVDLILKSNKKISIQAYNDSVGDGIYKILEGNDLIIKRRGSDTIYIYKKKSNSLLYDYYFLLYLNE